MELETIPRRLFTNLLPTGEQEFFCYVRISPERGTQSPIERVTWRVTSDGGNEITVSGMCPVSEREQKSGRIGVAAVLPSTWVAGQLAVEFHYAQTVFRAAWPVARYAQPPEKCFRLPLAGFVIVLIGHRIGQTHRAAWQVPSQQFGWDLLPLTGEGWRLLNTAFSERIAPADFAGFGQEVLAPGPGRVVQATNGNPDLPNVGSFPDLRPYLDDLRRAEGNCVIIEHGDGIWSCLAHLQQGSVRVQTGTEVEAGQVIGALGNSGFSSGPHLHLHFMDGPDSLTAAPLPVLLDVEGARYAPTSGEILSS